MSGVSVAGCPLQGLAAAGVVAPGTTRTFAGGRVGVGVSLPVPVGAALLTMDLEAGLEGVGVVPAGDGLILPPLLPEAGKAFPSFVTVNWTHPESQSGYHGRKERRT